MDIVAAFLDRILSEQPTYVGIYKPGDFKSPTYRVILPNPSDPRIGRGFHNWREEVLLETNSREDIDNLIRSIQGLVGLPAPAANLGDKAAGKAAGTGVGEGGPIAVRHIKNPSQNKDEGLRLVWRRSGDHGVEEVRDWERRDAMIRDGKTVRAVEEEMLPLPAPVGGEVGHGGMYGVIGGGGAEWMGVPVCPAVGVQMMPVGRLPAVSEEPGYGVGWQKWAGRWGDSDVEMAEAKNGESEVMFGLEGKKHLMETE
ncbi:hypothetical protein IAT38_008403 [Cryptococcus sp. DSM 104549]